ncbi:MAG: hypothetical protein ACE5EM_03300 [Sphingomonadales bacterium]
MVELGILWAFMILVIVVMGGLLTIFHGWMQRRRELEKEQP